jgi:SAM-dependent methyltransferase
VTGRLSHCRLCNLEDFADPELRELIREAFSSYLEIYGQDFPDGTEYRKFWEVAMTLRAFRELGVVRPDAEILGVAAGAEATLFWLTSHVRRVFATDLYDVAEGWGVQAPPTMLLDAAPFASCRWDPRRLVVQYMNALDLRYDDASFDAVFSSSSIEHFGGRDEVRRALQEVERVLRPGGIFALSTELHVDGLREDMPGTIVFDRDELPKLLLDGFDWELVEPLDLTLSPRTRSHELPLTDALGAKQTPFPHILLEHQGMLWTSVHVVLRKAAQQTAPVS